MRRDNRTVTLFEILYDTGSFARHDATIIDGTAIFRTRDKSEAMRFASAHTCYGKPCRTPEPVSVPARLANRWGV